MCRFLFHRWGGEVLRDIGEFRCDLSGRVLAGDAVATIGEHHGDCVDRVDLLTTLCFAGYVSPDLCHHFMGYPGNDVGYLELAMLVLGGGDSGLTQCDALVVGYDDIVATLLQ